MKAVLHGNRAKPLTGDRVQVIQAGAARSHPQGLDAGVQFGVYSESGFTWRKGAMRRVRYCCAISLDGYLAGPGGDQPLLGLRTYVVSRTLRRSDYRNVTIVGEDWKAVVQSLREGPGKDIWLFGGGALFRSLAEAGMVDTVEVAVIPTLLGGGIPLVAEPAARIPLTLTERSGRPPSARLRAAQGLRLIGVTIRA